MFSALENKELNKFRKTFLEFDNYVASLSPSNTDRKYLKSCFDTFQELYTNILLQQLVNFYNQEVLYVCFEHLQSLEQKHKVNLPSNLLLYTLMYFKILPSYYHYLIKIVSDFNGDDFFDNEELVEKILFAFKMIDSNKADEVICTIGQLAVDR